jgi:hypothetical protein
MKTFFLFIPILVLMGCTSNKKIDTKEIINGDTLTIAKVVFNLDSISEREFKNADRQKFKETDSEEIEDTTNVKRDSLKLTFHLRNGADSVLINDTTEDWSGYIYYSYIESCNNIDYWLLGIDYYEGSQFLLLDREKGDKIWIWGKPVFSPDNKHFITYSCDLEAGYDPNGLELFEIDNKKAIHKWSKLIGDWGPSEIRWKNDSIIYIEQMRIDYEKDAPLYSYKSMVIK